MLESIFTEHPQRCSRLLRTQTKKDRYRGERPPQKAHTQTKPEAHFTFICVRVPTVGRGLQSQKAGCCAVGVWMKMPDRGRGGVCTHLSPATKSVVCEVGEEVGGRGCNTISIQFIGSAILVAELETFEPYTNKRF